MLSRDRRGRLLAPVAIAGGAASELVVLHGLGGAMAWAPPVVLVLGGAAAVALALPGRVGPRGRGVAVAVALAALLAAPAAWAAQTLGHAESGTFPAGGPASAMRDAGPRGFGRFGAGGFGSPPRGAFRPPPAGGAFGAPPGGAFGPPPGRAFGSPPGGAFGSRAGGAFGPGSGPGGFGGNSAALRAAEAYAEGHGGGTIGVSSQSSAAAAILSSNADVAGLGGFSGRESSVSAQWLAAEVASGRLRWLLLDSGLSGAPGDTRTGSRTAMSAAATACTRIALTGAVLYDCAGRANAILATR
jgi:hypothetical protein